MARGVALRRGTKRLPLGVARILPWQDSFLRDESSVKVCLGGWGSAKTTTCALDLARHAFSQAWRPEYGESHPESLVIGKTDKVIVDSSFRALKQVLPAGFIVKELRSPGERCLLLANGHLIKARTWSGSIEGLNVTAGWLDEAHLLDDAEAFSNYVARARDPLASRTLFLVSGLPVFGWLQDTFGEQGAERFPDSRVWQVSTYANTFLPAQAVARLKASCSNRSAETFLHGKFATPELAIYFEYAPALHLVDDEGDRNQACHLSFDVGNRAAALWLQERSTYLTPSGARARGKSLHVVDELTPDNKSVGQMMQLVKARGWPIIPGRSNVYVDPTADRDELAAIRAACPGVRIVKAGRQEKSYRVEYGIRCVNAALRDADGNTRLTFNSRLPRGPRSLVTALPQLRRKDNLTPHKDNRTDHIGLDCLRYPVAHLLPQMAAGLEVRQ